MTSSPPTTMDVVREVRQSIPVNVEALARRLGVAVAYEPLPDHISGYVHHANGQWRIVVNAVHARPRQRFTLAHELGHFIWHRSLLGEGTNDTRKYRADAEYQFYNNAIDRKHEREANQFAASLLMPGDMVRHAHRRAQVNDPARLADLFGVSSQAMEIRLENLAKRDEL